MGKTNKPNHLLRYEREKRGLSQKRIAEMLDTDTSMVSRWESGDRKPEPIYREKLCKLFEKNAEELGFIERQGTPETLRTTTAHTVSALLTSEERDGCFSFGKLKTTWITLDGDGRGIYLPHHIRSHYIPFAQELPLELQVRRDHIQQEQEQKKEQGLPFFWNGEIYALDRFVIGREATHENMTLDLWFRPSDYYTFLATNMSLNEPALREKYLADVDWYDTVPYFSNSFGVSLAIVTSDGYTLFTQRGKNVGSRPRIYETSVVEGLSRPLDRGTGEEAPDVYRCACRGLAEELGLHELVDYAASDITFLSFGVDTRYGLRGLTGIVKVKKTMEKVLLRWENGVRDKFENQKLFPVPFTPKEVIAFAYAHQPFAPGPTLYHALVYEYGHSMVEDTFDQLSPFFADHEG